MKKILTFFAVGLLFTSPAFAAPAGPWHLCQQAEECTAAQGPCGSWALINKKHLAEAEEYYATQNKVVECFRFEDAPKPQSFTCEQGECRGK